MKKAVAYLRTSSATNVGTDKDSEKRQLEAIENFAKQSNYKIVETFYDEAVSGSDPIETRAGFASMLDKIENGVRTVIIEDASRFARDLMIQELGLMIMVTRGVKVLTSNGDDLTETDDPMKKAMRQVAGAFAELEKTRLVSKLRVARERKKQETGRCEGRPAVPQEVIKEAKRFRRKKTPSGRPISYDKIGKALFKKHGFTGPSGLPYHAASVRHMLVS